MTAYTLTKLLDRLNRARHNPPSYAEGEHLVEFLRGSGTPVTPWESRVFVETCQADGMHAGQVKSVRFERDNGQLCLVLSTEENPE